MSLSNFSFGRILYYYDQSFTILEIFHSEMAEKFSFDLRRIKKYTFFSDVTITIGRNSTVLGLGRTGTASNLAPQECLVCIFN